MIFCLQLLMISILTSISDIFHAVDSKSQNSLKFILYTVTLYSQIWPKHWPKLAKQGLQNVFKLSEDMIENRIFWVNIKHNPDLASFIQCLGQIWLSKVMVQKIRFKLYCDFESTASNIPIYITRTLEWISSTIRGRKPWVLSFDLLGQILYPNWASRAIA